VASPNNAGAGVDNEVFRRHITFPLQATEELEGVHVRFPNREFRALLGGRRSTHGQSFGFHLEITLGVDVGGLQGGVTQPSPDRVDIHSRAEQMHGGGVTTMPLAA
jgi:hypothetical protein